MACQILSYGRTSKTKKYLTHKEDNKMICPKCKIGIMNNIGTRTGGFSAGKAAIGAVVAGPLGVAAGALGKKKITYKCNLCGYTIEK